MGKLTFMLCPFYVFFSIFFLMYVFHFLEQNKTSYFLKLGLQRQTWNIGLVLPANSHSFFPGSHLCQHVQPVAECSGIQEEGEIAFTGTVGSVVVTPSAHR